MWGISRERTAMRYWLLGIVLGLTVSLGIGAGQASADTIIFSDNFDGAQGGVGWTTWKFHPSYPDDWEMGAPSFAVQAGLPTGAYSSPNVYATDLNGPYENSTSLTPIKVLELYTPAIDLTGYPDATLTFVDFMQTESGHLQIPGLDYCSLEVTDTSGTHLGWLAQTLEDFNINGWVTNNSYSLNSYLNQTIKIGFSLYADIMGPELGWYIDDVQVTTTQVPEPMTLLLVGGGVVMLWRRRRG